jgi:hypothetical protein
MQPGRTGILLLLLLPLLLLLRYSMLLRSLLLLPSFFALFACQEYKVTEVKDFRIYAETTDPELQHALEVLTNRYNKQMGSEALTLVDRPEDSNSKIRFRTGLHEDGHKLGLGQWITTSKQSSSLTIQGEKNTETIAYTMSIEFDQENFDAKAPFIDDSSSDEAIHLYHLFCHEVGHGLQMVHSTDNTSVMYPTIPEKPIRYIDYKAYFNRARSFLSSH